ncbi:MAG: alpha/beta hydrolase [Spirochaetaceae bacterium]|jgi:fermentation-respiration switch protein FrsA (DUF1100 family)|nr:alpha/beta hydrolase [Spirochaetaceae bacterium]
MNLGIIVCILGVLFFAIVWGAPEFFYAYVLKRKTPHSISPVSRLTRKTAAVDEPPPWLTSQPYEIVGITSHDGLRLNACFLSAPDPAGSAQNANTPDNIISPYTAILAHGYTGNALQMSIFARFFYEDLGYNVLIPENRGHGDSEGTYIGMGWPDRLDYMQWIDWVKERIGPAAGNTPLRIVLYGISMGGATVMMTGGEALPPEVKAIIEDCGYTSVEDQLYYQMKSRYHLKSRWLMNATSRVAKKRAGYGFAEASALEQVKKIKVPILFIHGGDDTFVPTNMVYSLYEACSAPKELFVVPGAGHGVAYTIAGQEYEERISRFLRQWAP